jgi:hypothetical protein
MRGVSSISEFLCGSFNPTVPNAAIFLTPESHTESIAVLHVAALPNQNQCPHRRFHDVSALLGRVTVWDVENILATEVAGRKPATVRRRVIPPVDQRQKTVVKM